LSIGGVAPDNLQAALAAATADNYLIGTTVRPLPHAPISCGGKLWYHEDGTFACEHVEVPSDDARTQAILDVTIAILLIEMAFALGLGPPTILEQSSV